MTINDLPLNERCHKIRALSELLALYSRDGKERALFNALADIESLARDAQWRLNEMRFK